MAKKVNKKEPVKRTRKSNTKAATTVTKKSGENIVWIAGLILMVCGVIAAVSVVSHMFNWSADVASIAEAAKATAAEKITFNNICGSMGAYMGYWLVDKSFGLFGVLIPLAMVFFGWQMFRCRKLHLNYVGLSVSLLVIIGATTLGYIANAMQSEHLWGGDLGAVCAKELCEIIGDFGLIMVLAIAWILTGVFINSSFIGFINSIVSKVENKVENLTSKLSEQEEIAQEEQDDEQEDDATEEGEPQESDATPVTPAPARQIKSVDHKLEDDFVVVKPEPKVEEPEVKEEGPQEDEDGFTLLVDGVLPKKKVNVDILLEDTTAVDNLAPQEPAQEFDEDGFLVDRAETKQITPEPENTTPTEDDEIIIKVMEPSHKTIDEEDVVDDLYNPLLDLKSYHKPDVRLLEDYQSPHKVSDEEIYDNKRRIEETLNNFGIPIVEINATVGPTITLYEIVQAQGVKISKIQGLEKDIAQSLKSLGIRIIAPIPGRGTIGIEVPNRDKQIVSMRSSILSSEFQNSKAQLPVVIGRTIQNQSYVFDLAKLPHLLVAGATGQGKSVGLNAIITSLLYSKHPAELKFVLIDPKMVEFPIYSKIERHFLAKMESEEDPIVTDPKRAVCVLNSLVMEMENRLQLCKMATTRNIVEYNEKFIQRKLNPNKGHRFLPYIVVIIDEFADLIMTAKEVEVPVMRLAQKARAVGIHLIVATQRPDVKVITGGIKANFPSRIAFRVMQMVDSKTIIDQPGANQLIGRGDMLFSKDGELTRIQCALVETKEVSRLVSFIALQQGYTEAYMLPEYSAEGGGDGGYGGGGSDSYDGESSKAVKYDPKYAEIARDIVANGRFSISSIQQTHEVGFNRAARIVRQLERDGIVGPQIGSKPREIKYYDLPSLEAKLQELGIF